MQKQPKRYIDKATIFIPLTFIAGVYGMNFSFMFGLEQYRGYFAPVHVDRDFPPGSLRNSSRGRIGDDGAG